MTPSHPPIPAEAIELVAEAIAKRRHEAHRSAAANMSSWDDINESWRQEQTAAATPDARAAFDALEMEVERRGRLVPALGNGMILEYRDTEYRLVSSPRWFPVKP